MATNPPPRRTINVEDAASVPLVMEPAVVEFIIQKARAFDVKVPPVEPDPGSNPADDDEREIIEDYPSDQTETELRDAIEQLGQDEAIDLLALFWVGRGDFSAAQWEEAREMAAQRGRNLAAYLMGEPILGDLLEEGLTALGYYSGQQYGPE
jgi:hypothetical protein